MKSLQARPPCPARTYPAGTHPWPACPRRATTLRVRIPGQPAPGAQLPSGDARQAALPPARSAALDAGFTCTKEHTRGQPPEGYSVLVQVEIQMRNRRPCRTLLMWLWLRPVRQSIHDLAV